MRWIVLPGLMLAAGCWLFENYEVPAVSCDAVDDGGVTEPCGERDGDALCCVAPNSCVDADGGVCLFPEG